MSTTPSSAPSPALSSSPPDRRTVVIAGAWSIPAVALSVSAPAFATSADSVSARLGDPVLQRNGTTTLTVTVLDGGGVPRSGRAVSLQVADNGVTVDPVTGSTDAQGVFTSTVRVSSDAQTGTRSIGVATADGSTAISVTVAGPLMLTVSPSTVVAGASASARARIVDAQGSPVAREVVTFEGDGPVGLTPTDVVTGADGYAEATVEVDADAIGGAYTVHAYNDTYGEAAATVDVAARLALEVSPTSFEQGGSATARVVVRDAAGQLASGADVTFSVESDDPDGDPSGVSVSPSSVRTGSDGSAVVTITAAPDARVGRPTLTATSTYTHVSVTLDILAPVVPLAISLSPALVGWGRASTVSVTATASDRSPAAGVRVTLSATGGDVTLSATTGTTNAQGQLSVTASVASSPSSSGERTITASWGAQTAAATLMIDAVRTRITGMTRPHALAIANTTAYVVDGARMVVLSTATNAIVRTAALPAACYDIAMAGGKMAYLNAGDGRVFVYEPASNKVIATITRPGGGNGSGQVAVNATKQRVYACLPYDDQLMIANTQNNTYLTSLSFPRVYGVAVGRGTLTMFVYVVDGDGKLHMILASDNSVIETIDLGVPGGGPIAVSADGERGYIAARDGYSSWFIAVDLRSLEVLSTTSIPAAATGVAISPDGARVYTSSISGTVTAFSTSDYSRTNAFPAGPAVSSIAIASGSATAYVTNYDTTAPGVSVVDIR